MFFLWLRRVPPDKWPLSNAVKVRFSKVWGNKLQLPETGQISYYCSITESPRQVALSNSNFSFGQNLAPGSPLQELPRPCLWDEIWDRLRNLFKKTEAIQIELLYKGFEIKTKWKEKKSTWNPDIFYVYLRSKSPATYSMFICVPSQLRNWIFAYSMFV